MAGEFMKYRLTALTPLLVGDGQRLSPIDYMVWKDQVNVLNQQRIFRLLAKGPRLDGYLSQLKKADKLDFASWGGFAQNFAGRRIPFEHASSSGIWERARGESLFIPTFHSGHAGPFLPGSALKGALRTGLVFARTTPGSIKEIASYVDGERTARNAGEEVEAHGIGEGGSSRARAFGVSDSEPVAASNFQVYLLRVASLVAKGQGKFEVGWKQSQRGTVDTRRMEESTPVFAEMAIPGTAFEGHWNEKALFQDRQVLDMLRWREAPRRDRILAAANDYAAKQLELHRQYADSAGLPKLAETVAALEARLAEIREAASGCLVSMGWGGGLLSKSAMLDTTNEDYRKILKNLSFYSRAISTGLPFPKTRRIVFLGNEPASLPGWSLLEVQDPAD